MKAGLPGAYPANINRNANSSMNTFHKSTKIADQKDAIVGWALFLDNKSASNADLWKEPPQTEVFPAKILSEKMDLKLMEVDIDAKVKALKDKIEKRKEEERKKKEDVNDEAKRQKREQENERKKRYD